ncbi:MULTISPECIES: ATP-binding protein [Asticcacaulis]|uniref:sensor histidine kinase n=1 Tax=Asticcacaulis TaxID=76890 RepID=UPI0028667512|nr:ATP-binding protein [Asticcacaulis sp. BE141]MBP2157717.1 signal transduction histidine kinase [Asticcacaulis solisilvae]MDR6798762.1 signal transduction histidine kinase [Asticcacaulis sp. BE141]
MSSSGPKSHHLISLPIFWQVLGLSLAVLVLALGINTLIVLKAPDPPPPGYSIHEVATALRSGEVRLNNGKRLRAETTAVAPAYVDTSPEHRRLRAIEAMLAARLAAELKVPADSVWVKFTPHHMGGRWARRIDDGPPPGDGGGPHMVMREEFRMRIPGDGGPPPLPQGEPGPRFRVFSTGNGDDVFYPSFSAAWKLADGRYRVVTPPKAWIQPWQTRLLLGFGLTALLILPLAWWLSRRLTRPIIAFSEAASKVGFEAGAPPILAVGPREVRAAADVLNAMQARIRKQMESRTALMGAIAHDLKTPLARMRLRIEDLPSPLKDKLGDDISHMDGLIKSAMSFTAAHKLGESLRPVDFSALVEALAEDMAAVCPMEPARIDPNIMVRGDTVALKRVITNLIENACRYAGDCRLELTARGDHVELRVSDHGPGLPPDMLEAVFEPFFRMETSRNRDTGGAGLGLSVARALVEAQGGTLTLANRYEGRTISGLEAKLTLPRPGKI